MSRRVVITGMGAVTPLGTGVDKFWAGVTANKIGFSYIDKFDTEGTGIKIAGIVRDFDETVYYNVAGCFDKKEAKRMDMFTKYAVVSAHEALEDAGTDFSDIDCYRAGVIVGSGIGGIDLTLSEYSKYLEKGPNRISPFYIPMMISNMAAGTIERNRRSFKIITFCKCLHIGKSCKGEFYTCAFSTAGKTYIKITVLYFPECFSDRVGS